MDKLKNAFNHQMVEEFREAGAVCLRGVFGPQWIDLVREGINKNLASPSEYAESLKEGKDGGAYFNDYCNWRFIRELQDYVFHSPAAQIAGTLLQSKYVSFYHDHVLVKEAGCQKATPWHQDQSYYPIDGDKVCSIWMPVDPVPLESALQFVYGSHRWGRWFRPRKFETTLNYSYRDSNYTLEDRLYENVPEEEILIGKHEILRWSMEPGDCIVFHMKMLHGAPANLTTSPRRVLSTRFLGDDTRISPRPWIESPPTYGGIAPGLPAVSGNFPIVWSSKA